MRPRPVASMPSLASPDEGQNTASQSGARAALLGLPILVGVVLAVLPPDADLRVVDESSAETVLAAAAAAPLASWIGLLLAATIYVVAVAAVLPLVRATSGRGGRLVRFGYALSVLGALGLAMANAVVGVSLRACIDHTVTHAAAVSFQVSLQQDQGPLLPLFLLGLGTFVGPLVMLVGAIWSPSVTWWQGLIGAALVVGVPVTPPGLAGLPYLAVTLVGAWTLTRLIGDGARRRRGPVVPQEA